MRTLIGIAVILVLNTNSIAQTDNANNSRPQENSTLNTSDIIMKKNKPVDDYKIFLYHLKLTTKFQDPDAWNEKTQEVVSIHTNFLHQLGRDGKLVMAGRTEYQPGHKFLFGIVVIIASSLEEAIQLVKDDPVVIAGIMSSAIHPFSLGIRYFENLSQ